MYNIRAIVIIKPLFVIKRKSVLIEYRFILSSSHDTKVSSISLIIYLGTDYNIIVCVQLCTF